MALRVTVAADGMLEPDSTPPNSHDLAFVRYDDPAALAASLRHADALVTRRVNVTAELLGGGGRLRLVQQVGVGTDRIDLRAAGALGVRVANTPGAPSNAVVEHTFLIILAALRGVEAQLLAMRGGGWSRAEVWSGEEIAGQTVGVIGYGSIGCEITRRAVAFDAQVLVNTRTVRPDDPGGVRFVDLGTLLRRSDVVVVAAALTAETRGLIGRAEIDLLKPSAFFVNIARGAIVDEEALIAALESGRIRGAALDAFALEPLPEHSPLRSLPNVVLTPHSAGSTRQSRERIWRQMMANLDRLAAGREPINVVNAAYLSAPAQSASRPAPGR